MFSSLLSQIVNALRSPRLLALLGVGAASVVSYAWANSRRIEPSAEEMERSRRDYLAATGRIVDGSITETHWIADAPEPTPAVLVYRYRIAGVTYDAAQDVLPLGRLVRGVRVDLPVQVRFDPRNPGDSIVVAETWTGLRTDDTHGAEPFSRIETA